MVIKINENVGDLLAASQIYQFLSTCLLEPNKEALDLLLNDDYMAEVKNCIEISGSSQMLETFDLLQRRVEGVDVEGLAWSYRATFGGSTVAMDCPPYEMYYSGSQIWQQTQDLADISGMYKAYGIEIEEDTTTSRWDHVAVELEFLHFLTYKIAYAIENHSEKEQESCISGKKKFLYAHIGRWIKAFSTSVIKKTPEEFYRHASALASLFIHIEMLKLSVDAEEIDEYMGNEPDYLQRLEGKSAMACDSCMDEEKYD
ncbi:nitrate reductase delta subunit [Candidatus Scalindua japonica]|uniref:Nitrate reductase delta subunit n=1 Tax=Candidatus Scalindua japonica TaxID=1284222 RepID=A0A286TU99_9BACT|nr:molecular chaperone TorD family protein [Candidatus Scalindua japonica]GAX59458.1 nitrate reductase delta subunit [Candidatus Scalindua japonica]